MTTRVILVRHGQTDWNSAGRFMGQKNIPLNATGIQQAQAVARRLSIERPQAIYASDLSRAWQTAEAIHSAICGAIETAIKDTTDSTIYAHSGTHSAPQHHSAIPAVNAAQTPALIAEARLREMDFGDWEGSTYAELQAGHPEIMAAWEADLLHAVPPGGESLLHMAGRVEAAYQDIVAAHPEGTAMLVAHGGPLQVLMAHAFGLPPERYWQFHLNNTGWIELNLYPSGAVLNRFNDTAHLDIQQLGARQ